LLRAIAEKLIPGIPEQTRVSILQQTRADETETSTGLVEAASGSGAAAEVLPERNVLQEVIEKATARFEIEQEIRSEHGRL
jgi:type II secretory pathway component PulM